MEKIAGLVAFSPWWLASRGLSEPRPEALPPSDEVSARMVLQDAAATRHRHARFGVRSGRGVRTSNHASRPAMGIPDLSPRTGSSSRGVESCYAGARRSTPSTRRPMRRRSDSAGLHRNGAECVMEIAIQGYGPNQPWRLAGRALHHEPRSQIARLVFFDYGSAPPATAGKAYLRPQGGRDDRRYEKRDRADLAGLVAGCVLIGAWPTPHRRRARRAQRADGRGPPRDSGAAPPVHVRPG